MSNVLQRFRNKSPLQYFVSMNELKVKLTRFVMNEKYVPKRYRFVVSIPTIDILLQLSSNVTGLNYDLTHPNINRDDVHEGLIISLKLSEDILQMLQYMSEVINDFDDTTAAFVDILSLLDSVESELENLVTRY